MEINNKENYKILHDSDLDIAEFATYLTQNHSEFKNDNVVIDILDKKDTESKDLLAFLEISDRHRAGKKSFVIASNPVAVETIPEDLIIAPTIREAEDIVNMEELERELGF